MPVTLSEGEGNGGDRITHESHEGRNGNGPTERGGRGGDAGHRKESTNPLQHSTTRARGTGAKGRRSDLCGEVSVQVKEWRRGWLLGRPNGLD